MTLHRAVAILVLRRKLSHTSTGRLALGDSKAAMEAGRLERKAFFTCHKKNLLLCFSKNMKVSMVHIDVFLFIFEFLWLLFFRELIQKQ